MLVASRAVCYSWRVAIAARALRLFAANRVCAPVDVVLPVAFACLASAKGWGHGVTVVRETYQHQHARVLIFSARS
jgi:hypothetical protein